MWDLDDALRHATYPRLGQPWEELGAFVERCGRGELLAGIVHGDFYPGNVITLRGQAVGVIDWENAKPEWLVWELARSLWEFAKDKQRHDLVEDRAGEFLVAYRAAGGPVPREEERLLVPMIRVVRLSEALEHLTNATRVAPGIRGTPRTTSARWTTSVAARVSRPWPGSPRQDAAFRAGRHELVFQQHKLPSARAHEPLSEQIVLQEHNLSAAWRNLSR
jgi:Ser/Thr protein kinase RdoA (MazF antagonist)